MREETIDEISYGVIVLFTDAAKNTFVCIVRHAAGHIAFPKGHPETGESPQETALREAREEAGISDVQLIERETVSEAYTFERGGRDVRKRAVYFIGHVADITPAIPRTDTNEITEVWWVPVDRAREMLTYDSAKQALGNAVQLTRH